MLTSLLSGSVIRMRLSYPLDASLPLQLVAILGALLYLSSLLLQVRYRGDFGVISDQRIRGGMGGRDSGGCCEMLRVPRSDISALLAPVSSSYGPALSHLKGDLKDV